MTLSRTAHYPGITPNPCTPEQTNRNWDALRRDLNEIGDDIDEALLSGVVFYELTAALTPGGSAAANLLEWNSAAWAPVSAITVHDVSPSQVWRGLAAYRGFARLRGDDSETQYVIVWQERIAYHIWGTLTSTLIGSPKSASASVSHYADGVDPGASIQVFDRNNRFPAAASGCTFEALYDFRTGRYELIVCQGQRWIATATAGADYDPTTAEIPITGVVFKSFAEYDFNPPAPATAKNTFRQYGKAGDPIHIQKSEQSAFWEIITGTEIGESSAIQLHRFRLSGNLIIGENAPANLLNFGGVTYATGDVIRVYDFYGLTTVVPGAGRGMWSGISGMEGWARRREVRSEGGTTEEYDIVWMEQFARYIHFELVENMGATEDGKARASVTYAWGQGCSPVTAENDELYVHDEDDKWHFAHTGAKGTAIRNEYLDTATPQTPHYSIITCQQLVLYGKAQLVAVMCPDDETGEVTQFVGWTPSLHNIALPEGQPTTAKNTFGSAGEEGTPVYVVGDFSGEEPDWHIVTAKHFLGQVITDHRWNSGTGCFQLKRIPKAALMRCEPETDWEDEVCFEECVPEP